MYVVNGFLGLFLWMRKKSENKILLGRFPRIKHIKWHEQVAFIAIIIIYWGARTLFRHSIGVEKDGLLCIVLSSLTSEKLQNKRSLLQVKHKCFSFHWKETGTNLKKFCWITRNYMRISGDDRWKTQFFPVKFVITANAYK